MIRKVTLSLLLMGVIAAAHGQATVDELFERLTVSETASAAASELQSRALSDPSVGNELEMRLPRLLSGPKKPTVWESEVKLAGDAHVVNCVPILVGYIRDSMGLPMVHTFTREFTQEGDLPAAALTEIGDPAVPALSELTRTGSRSAKLRAALILRRMHTTKSDEALQAYLPTVQNERVRQFLSTRETSVPSPR